MARRERTRFVGVVGAGACPQEIERLAYEVGALVAEAGCVLVCGGLGGVMTGAARGAQEHGGVTMGILPGDRTDTANPFIAFPVATNMGHARNAVIVHTADVLIAISGEYGTLSEIALALKLGKAVFALRPRYPIPGVLVVETPEEAVRSAIAVLKPAHAARHRKPHPPPP